MKKMVFMAAFVAACAAFVACSSDDDLVQQKPDVPEESVEEGIPMTIKVADLASRGTDFSIGGTNPLQDFTLYSTMSGAWETGKLFGKDSGGNWTTNTDLSWPNDNTYTFFAINDVENLADLDADSHKDAPAVTATTCSFNYALPTTLKPGTVDEYYYNSEDLKDLLVAKTTGSSTSGNPAGSLMVQFQHALAQITAIYVYANADRLSTKGYSDTPTYRFRINGIRLGGLKAIGTYTFDAVTPWSSLSGDAEFEIPLNIPTDPDADVAKLLAYNRMSFTPGTKDVDHAMDADPTKTTLKLPLTDGGLYLIPQTAAGSIGSDGAGGYQVDGAYAELDAQVFVFNSAAATTIDDDGWYHCCEDDMPMYFDAPNSFDAGYGTLRVPLKFTLEPGKGYSLTLDLSRGIIWDSTDFVHQPVFQGISFDTN